VVIVVSSTLVVEAVLRGREAGCERLQVDFEYHLQRLYFEATHAGFIVH
jgi:hypothetical protein